MFETRITTKALDGSKVVFTFLMPIYHNPH